MTNKIRAVMLFAVLVCLMLLPCAKLVRSRAQVAYRLPESELTAILFEEQDVFEQELIVKGTLKELRLYTENYGRDNEGTLKLTIAQDGNVMDTIYWDIRNAGSYVYNAVPLNPRTLTAGNIRLTIEAQDYTEDTRFALFVADEDLYEIDCAKYNGVPMSGPMIIGYDAVDYQNPELQYSYLMIAIIVLLCGASAFLLVGCEETEKSSSFLQFAVRFLIFFSLALKYPICSFMAEPWAELGSDFLLTAQSGDLFGGLFMMEQGLYLTLFNRLVCLIVVRLFGTGWLAVVVLQIFALLFVAFCCAFICSISFRKYAPRTIRVLFAIALAGILTGGENIMIIGVVYFGSIFIMLCLLLDFTEISTAKWITYTSISVLFCLSKMSFCIFFLAAVFYLIFGFQLLDRRKKIYLGVVSAAAVLEPVVSVFMAGRLLTTGAIGTDGIGVVKTTVGLGELMNAMLYYQTQVFSASACISFLSRMRELTGVVGIVINLVSAAGIIAILTWTVIGFRSKDTEQKERAIQVLCLGILSFAQCFLTVFTTPTAVVGLEGWKTVQYIVPTRWFQMSYTAVLLIFLILVGTVFDRWKLLREREFVQKGAYVVVYLAVLVFVVLNGRDIGGQNFFTSSRLAFSDWNNLHSLLGRERYCVATLPEGWFVKNEEVFTGQVYRQNEIVVEPQIQKADMLYATKYKYTNTLFDREYFACLYDDDNQVIRIVGQCTNPQKNMIGFDLYDVEERVSKIMFRYEDGSEALIDGMYYIGYS